MIQWEYRIEKIGATACGQNVIGIIKAVDPVVAVRSRLDNLGAEGWELVSVCPPFVGQGCDPVGTVLALLYFKRQKQ